MLVVFLWIGTTLPFFHLEGKTPASAHCLKIFNIRMLLILSWNALDSSLSFELLWQYRPERKLQKINDCQSNIAYVLTKCSYCLLGNTVKKNELKNSAFSKK